MPRIYDGESNPLDFCQKHFPTETEARRRYGAGEGPDGRGNCFDYDADHPDYADDYRCEVCGTILKERDN